MSRDTETSWKQAAQSEKKLAEYWEVQYTAEKERVDKAMGAFEQIRERIEEARTDWDEMGWRYALNDINNIILGYEDDTEG